MGRYKDAFMINHVANVKYKVPVIDKVISRCILQYSLRWKQAFMIIST